MSQLHTLDLQDAKELKHCLSSTLYHGNFSQLEILWKRTTSILDAGKVHQRCVKAFTSSNLAIAIYAFDFIANLKIDCQMSKEATNKTLSTHIHHYCPTSWGDKRLP
jgi:hypothetical protein